MELVKDCGLIPSLVGAWLKLPFSDNIFDMGAVSGIAGYHLASILWKFNPESLLCDVSNLLEMPV